MRIASSEVTEEPTTDPEEEASIKTEYKTTKVVEEAIKVHEPVDSAAGEELSEDAK